MTDLPERLRAAADEMGTGFVLPGTRTLILDAAQALDDLTRYLALARSDKHRLEADVTRLDGIAAIVNPTADRLNAEVVRLGAELAAAYAELNVQAARADIASDAYKRGWQEATDVVRQVVATVEQTADTLRAERTDARRWAKTYRRAGAVVATRLATEQALNRQLTADNEQLRIRLANTGTEVLQLRDDIAAANAELLTRGRWNAAYDAHLAAEHAINLQLTADNDLLRIQLSDAGIEPS